MTAVCIAGMHRSGTSMVARLLNLCGIYLGEETDLIPGEKDNPEGFWENMNFQDVNNRILQCFNGAWDLPPALQPGWESSSLLDPVRNKATRLINEMGDHQHWGWKDPRSSLTVPFWQKLIPDVKIVICLRSPSEVVNSLKKRGYSSSLFSSRLWYTYYEYLLANVRADKYIITHYANYFYDSGAELKRVLSFLDVKFDKEKIKTTEQIIRRDLKHHKSSLSDTSEFNSFPEIIEMYTRLCAQAGPVFQRALLDKKYDTGKQSLSQAVDFMGNQLSEKERQADSLQNLLSEKEKQADSLQKQLTALRVNKEQSIKAMDNKLQEYIDWIANKDQLINDLKSKLQEHVDWIANKDQLINDLKSKLQEHVDWIANKDQLINDLKSKLQEHVDWIANRDQLINDLKSKLQEHVDWIANKDQLINDLKSKLQEHVDWIANRDQLINDLKSKLQEHVDWIANRDQLINEQKWQLEVIHNTFGWKDLKRVRQINNYIKGKVFPPGAKKTHPGHLSLKAYRVWRDEGTKSLLNNIYHAFRILFRRKHKVIDIDSQLSDFQSSQKVNSGIISKKDMYVPIDKNDVDPHRAEVKPIAIYLPQFHPIPENDEWWGKGFTEWTNVSKALPNFKGHYQPRIPDELGYYDLRILDVQKRQVQLAKKYGIYGFCFYYYWFDGKRLLERPINQYLENPDIDFPFCFCWANENWTRCWDGEENNILIGQNYSKEGDKNFIQEIIPAFRDKRYIRVDGKPLLVIYRVNLLPDPKKTAEIWRSECQKSGIGDIYLAVAQSFGISDPRPYGFDGAIEFPMHHLGDSEIDQNALQINNPEFNGRVFDYRIAAQMMMKKPKPAYPLFKTIVPSWDNTARRQNEGHIFVNSSPEEYKKWLDNIVQFTKKNHTENNRFIFINAWNEWAEGNYLEPDSRYGYAYLEATAKAIAPGQKRSPVTADWTILFVSHDAELGGAQIVLLNQLEWFKKHTTLCIKVLCLQGGKLLTRFKKLADTMVLSSSQKQVMEFSPDELTGILLDFCNGTPDLIYGNTVAAGQSYHWLSKLGVPILTHFHELEMSIKEYGKPWIGMILNHSSHFLACSRPVHDNLIKNYGVKEINISVVHSSVPSDNLTYDINAKEKNRIKKKLGLVQNKLLVFGCGIGLPFRKGADIFIETARILRQEGRENFHFYWVGGFEENIKYKKFGAWSDYLKRLHNSNLSSYVTFLGKKENPKAYFQAGDIFLLPSREDPFPLVALEAADCRLPTICFENIGTVDLVENDAGFIVPFEDVETMTQRLITLMDDEVLRKRMGARAQEKFRNNFTVERTTPHILKVCRNVANQKPGVSVIVPNYNHEEYLPQRLDSIFNQTYQDFEVILLDDASEDRSLDVLKQYANRGDVKIVTNKTNSSSPFKQWLKGFDLAKSDIWWVAESDDDCDPDFLRSLVPAFNDHAVRMAYANSSIIDENGDLKGDYLNTEYLTALSRTKWKTNYKIPSEQEINDGLGVKNTILNVSAVLFRRIELDDKIRKTLEEMRIAGDWYFIVNIIKGGKVQYDARKLNSHRRHAESVIGKLVANKKVDSFYKEMSVVHKAVIKEYRISKDFCAKWEQFQQDQWKGFYGDRPFDELKDYYPFEEISEKIKTSINS